MGELDGVDLRVLESDFRLLSDLADRGVAQMLVSSPETGEMMNALVRMVSRLARAYYGRAT